MSRLDHLLAYFLPSFRRKILRERLLDQTVEGLETLATIVSFENDGDEHILIYQYIADLGEGKIQTCQGAIRTGWDIVHIALSGGSLPHWKDVYDCGYTFPVRYFKAEPTIHCILESFTF